MKEQPLGSDLENPIDLDSPGRKFFSPRDLLIICAVVVILFVTLVPNFMKARARGQLTACKSNLKNLATALEMYAGDNQGNYPKELDKLIPRNYLRQIPTCPSRSAWSRRPGHDYSYEVATQPDSFSMTCRGDHAHAYRGFDADPHGFPQYDSKEGLIDHP
ncbi:MAG: hypothetical protein KF760_06845 [Candidatus Eremiobacteraeota bacterium]|nr:hypothetical protein [Candidatus Eremiobacteraeota bacterium]MCW5866789.1 hypothetical protein [Candidatus Eremiobacteraeota bacterium]